MYVTVDFICIRSFELWATRRHRELQNEKFLSTAGFEPTISRLLYWRSNGLSSRGSDFRHLKVNDNTHYKHTCMIYMFTDLNVGLGRANFF